MSIKYHGNWCGPGWSNGEFQPSERGYAPPVDEFDATCQDHDNAYADGVGIDAADDRFYDSNIGRGFKRSVAALLVRGKQLTRPSPNKSIEDMSRMRGVPVRPMPVTLTPSRPKAPNRGGQRPTRPSGVGKTTLAPVSIGTTLTSSMPKRTVSNGVTRLAGREFMGSVIEANSTNWQMSSLCPLHPAYFPGSTLSNVARGFTKYRWRSLTVHFVTRLPTSVTGEIILAYSANCLMPAEDGSSAGFLPRVMTRGNAILGPLWTSHSIRIPCDSKTRLVDAFSSVNFNENVMGEVQAYTLSSASDTAGYLIFDYDVEYMDVMYQPHSTIIPIVGGAGTAYTLTTSSTTPTASNAVQFSCAALATYTIGTVFRMIVDLDQSTLSTGTTAANALSSNVAYASNTTTMTSTTIQCPLVDGFQMYIVCLSNASLAYVTYEAAISGDTSGQLFYRTTGSTAAVIQAIGYYVRTAANTLSATQ